MANIPLTNKIHTVTSGVETVNRGSAQANAGREAYTIQDLADTIGGGAVDSVVAGNNVTVSPTTGNVVINADIGGSGTTNQLALFTASGTIGNSLLSASSSGGANYIYVGNGSAPVSLVVGSASNIIWQPQGSAPSSLATAGTDGQMVLFFDGTAADGIYVCISAGAAGSATWKKSALTPV